MRWLPIIAIWVLASVVPVSGQSTADDTAADISDCPAYAPHLAKARRALEHGDRAAALTELRQARVALDSCIRNQEGEVALAAYEPAPSRTRS